MGAPAALGALLASLLILGAEYLPAGLWSRAPVWEPGSRLALLCLLWSAATALPLPLATRARARAGALSLAWCVPALSAALALEAGALSGASLGILLVGIATIGATAAAGASPYKRRYLVLVLGLGLGLPLLAACARWGAGAGEAGAWLQMGARLSPLGWLAGAAAGEQELDAWLAPYALALLCLAAWPQGEQEQGV